MDNQWEEMVIIDTQLPKISKSGVKDQFKKYKKIDQKPNIARQEQTYEQLFSNFTYKPIEIQINQKQNFNPNSSRSSTNQSDICELSLSTCGDSTLSVFTVTPTVSINIQTSCEQDLSKPAYIRQFNRLNSMTPNYSSPSFQMKTEMTNLIKLIKQCRNSINFVFNCAVTIAARFRKLKIFSKSSQRILTLEFFLHSGWENINLDPSIKMLKPERNFRLTHTFEIVLNQLDLLLAKTSRYELATSLTQQIGLDLYKNIRENLSQIQQKLIQCSNSIYYLSLKNEYPEFYYKYLQILRTGLVKFSQKETKSLIHQFRKLWEVQQPITSSQIGKKVWFILNGVQQNLTQKQHTQKQQ